MPSRCLRLGQKRLKVQRRVAHAQTAFGIAGPFVLGAVAVQFDPVAIGVGQIDRLAHAMVGGPVQRDACAHHPRQRIGQSGAVGIEDRGVVEPRVPRWRGCAARAFPGVEPDMVVIAASGQKGRAGPVSLGHFKAEHAAVEGDGPVQIGDFQVNMADACGRGDGGLCHWLSPLTANMAPCAGAQKACLRTVSVRVRLASHHAHDFERAL